MKRLLVLLAALAVASSATAQEWAKARIAKSPRHLEWITLKHDGREVKAYIGYPESKTKTTAVVVIHEIFGHTDWVQSVVDQLAEAGYIAIAPDLLSGMAPNGGGTVELGANVGRVINTIPAPQLNADLDAAVDYVSKDVACNGKVVVGGFCWGGGKTFSYAVHNPNIKAGLVFYGTSVKPEEMAAIKAPIYGFYASNDARITAAVPKTGEDMKAAGKAFDQVTYEGATHGFMRAGEDPAGTEANKKARDEGWTRVKAILSKI